MFIFNPKKLVLLLFVSLFVYAAAIGHVQFNVAVVHALKGTDLIFANGFEIPGNPAYSSDPVVDIADVPAIEAGSESVGSIAGSFQNDQMGQANYSIPILTGAGTAGLAPQLALNYSSGSGNGALGVGWSLSGTTIITRCRETTESRDAIAAITPEPLSWDDNDKLCLNGERLYKVTGTSYWSDGTTYRTEKDQFARITYIDASHSFTIERKDGSTAYYGDTTDSNIQASDVTGSPTYAWAISRFVDNMSNYIDYTYTQYNDLEFVLSDIDYTGHLVAPIHAPYNNIHFDYQSRNDTTVGYIAGAKTAMTQRLEKITSKIDNVIVRTYTPTYIYSNHSSRSIMTSILECRDTVCLPTTTFNWSQPNVTFETSTSSSGNFPNNIKSSKLGDINGDGRADLVFVDNGDNKFKVAYGQGSTGFGFGNITNIPVPTGTEIDNQWHLIDYNADGRQDLMRQDSLNNWVIHLAGLGTGGLSASAINTGLNAYANSDFQIVDINGDGLADLLYANEFQLKARYLQKNTTGYEFSNTLIAIDLPNHPSQINGVPDPSCVTGQICINEMVYRFFADDEINIRTHDANGDGVVDLFLRSDVYQTIVLQQNIAQPSYRFLSANQDAENLPSIQGKPREHKSSHWVAFIYNGINNTGALDYDTEKYFIADATSLTSSADKDIKFSDLNADGLTDVLINNVAENWQYKLGTGKGFTTTTNIGTISNSDHLQLIDYNSDGYMDMLFPGVGSSRPYFVKKWTGNGFLVGALGTSAQAINLTNNVNLFLDLNGDGRADHLRIDAGGIQRLYIRQDTYAAVDKITDITNGIGASTTIDYKPLTFSTVYHQGKDANQLNYGNDSPVFDYLSSMYVVQAVTTDTPTQADANATTTMTYQYRHARVQAGGRGFLGFGTILTSVPVKSSNETQNYLLQTTTTYQQQYPYIGLPKTVTVTQFEVPPPPPPICTIGDTCFPTPCLPSEPCTDPQRNILGTGLMLSQTINTFAKFNTDGSDGTVVDGTIGKAQFAYIDETIEQTYAPNGTGLLKTRVQSTTHDDFGNPLTNSIKIYTGSNTAANLLHTTTTTNTYSNTTSNWKIGLLESTSAIVSRPDKASVTILMQYDYNSSTGLLSEERRLPNDTADKFLRILHKYDNYGNEIKTISCSGIDFTNSQCSNTSNLSVPDVSNPTLIHRYNELVFDAKGRYANQVKNSLAQTVSTINSRDIYGNPKTTTDLLGTTTSNTYNVFGAAQTSYSFLGTWTYASKKWCSALTGTDADNSCPANATIRVSNRASGGSLSYGFIDKLGRTISTTARSFNNDNDASTPDANEQWISNDQYYDNLGRGETTVGPYFFGIEPYIEIGNTGTFEPNPDVSFTHTEYDRYNRVTKVTLADGATESIAYTGFVTTTTNALNQTKTESKNALGEIIESADHLNTKLNYIYNSQGLVTDITRTIGTTTELLTKNTYDKAARKIQSQDVDTGTTISEYNAEGEIIKVIDAKGQYVVNYRDELGRVDLTENFDASNTKKLSTEQIYDPNNNQITDEIEHLGALGFHRNYVYDNLQRLITISITINDTQNVGCGIFGLCGFSSQIYYDQHSRAKTEVDASGKAIKNHYNAQGYLERITNAENEIQQYYQINKTDNRGNITQDTKAANIITDYSFDAKRGFMTNIINNSLSANIWYNYSYDQLGNLRKRADIKNLNSNIGQSECFYYDNLNRLTSTEKYNIFGVNCTTSPPGTNTISYNAKGNITNKDNQVYSYLTASSGTIGNSPHQVTQKGSQVFTYDVNGNNTRMTNFQSKNGTFQNRNIEYTTFNKVDRLWLGNDPNNPISQSTYQYDTSRQKFARIDTEGATTKVTYFIGNVEIEYNGTQVKYKRQLGNYAILTETTSGTEQAYLLTDHLGSIDTIFDENGTILQQMSFSAWGERRLPANWNTITIPTLRQQMDEYTNRGYTGHEMVDAFGIINMGGRIYDAALGRVLQADPFVQDPTNTQSFNRYTYVFNNPLSYTDPSGYFGLRQALGIVVGIVLSIYLGPLGMKFANIYWAAFWGGFASGAIITGSLKGALIGGFTAMATAAITNNIFDFIKGDPSTGLKGGAQATTTATSEALVAPLADGIIEGASTTGKVLTETAIKNSSQVATEIGKVLTETLDTITVIADSFRELLISEIKRTFIEMWVSTQVAMQGMKTVSLGQANINGTAYNMTMNVPATNFDRWIAGGVAVLSIGTAIAQLSKNLIRDTFGMAKGKVKDIFKKWQTRRRLQNARRLGHAGENAVRGAFDIGGRASFTGASGARRITDGFIDRVSISEIKNVAKQSLTSQLRDNIAFAQAKNLRFDLFVRSTTKLTGPLLNEIAKKNIILRFIPGT